MVVMMMMVMVMRDESPDDAANDPVVVMVMMMMVVAVMVVVIARDLRVTIELADRLSLARRRIGRPQRRDGVRNRIEQIGI